MQTQVLTNKIQTHLDDPTVNYTSNLKHIVIKETYNSCYCTIQLNLWRVYADVVPLTLASLMSDTPVRQTKGGEKKRTI